MRVELTTAASSELDRLPEPIHSRVLRILERLRNWPQVSGARPLRGQLAGRFRMRTGDYRVQFSLEGEAIVVEKIGHRDGFYEE
jgi:mRNA-degrading endonuclease RelE of RelBE toxin-antitoxin system